jgi:TonB family protein
MSAAAFTANLAAYLLQTTLLLAAGLLLPRLFGIRDPQVRLRYWYALMAFSLVLPFACLLEVRSESAGGAVTGALLGGLEVVVRPGDHGRSPWLWLPAVLAAVAAARMLWTLGGLVMLERLRRRSRALQPLPPALREASDSIPADAEFRTSPAVGTPLTFGWIRPVILLPEGVTEMRPEEQRCIALHELLHVRRRDWPAILLEESLRSLLWFHPALWLVLDRVALSREQSVDLEVVRITEARRTYMCTLSAMARTRQSAAAVAILPFFHRSHLLQRLALLTKEVSMSRLRLAFAAAGCATALLLCGAVASRAFPLLGQDGAPGAAAQVKGADAAKPPAPGSKTYTTEDGVKEPKILTKVPPAYPQEMRDKGIQGVVVIEAVIDEEGKPWSLTVVKSDNEGFNASALEAVKQWRWEPPTLNGKPVSLRWTLTLNFKLS